MLQDHLGSRFSMGETINIVLDGGAVPARVVRIGHPSYDRKTERNWRIYGVEAYDGIRRFFAATDPVSS